MGTKLSKRIEPDIDCITILECNICSGKIKSKEMSRCYNCNTYYHNICIMSYLSGRKEQKCIVCEKEETIFLSFKEKKTI
jgi:hypothetical protein